MCWLIPALALCLVYYYSLPGLFVFCSSPKHRRPVGPYIWNRGKLSILELRSKILLYMYSISKFKMPKFSNRPAPKIRHGDHVHVTDFIPTAKGAQRTPSQPCRGRQGKRGESGGEEAVESGEAEAGLGLELPEPHREVDPHPGRRPRAPRLLHRRQVAAVGVARSSPPRALLELLGHQQRYVRHVRPTANPPPHATTAVEKSCAVLCSALDEWMVLLCLCRELPIIAGPGAGVVKCEPGFAVGDGEFSVRINLPFFSIQQSRRRFPPRSPSVCFRDTRGPVAVHGILFFNSVGRCGAGRAAREGRDVCYTQRFSGYIRVSDA
jgi:hypothetical protein